MKRYQSQILKETEDYGYPIKYYISGIQGIKTALVEVYQDLINDSNKIENFVLDVGKFEQETNGIMFVSKITGKQSIILKLQGKSIITGNLNIITEKDKLSKVFISGIILKNKKTFEIDFH